MLTGQKKPPRPNSLARLTVNLGRKVSVLDLIPFYAWNYRKKYFVRGPVPPPKKIWPPPNPLVNVQSLNYIFVVSSVKTGLILFVFLHFFHQNVLENLIKGV